MKKRWLAFITVMILVTTIALAGCGNEAGPSAAVKEDMEAYRADLATRMAESEDLDMADLFESSEADALIDMMADFEYEIINEEVDGDNAEVDVKIKTYPFGDALEEVMPTIFMAALAGGSEDAMVKSMIKAFTDLNEKSYSKTVTIHCTKNGDGWKTDINEENLDLLNALSGGIYDAVENIASMFGFDYSEDSSEEDENFFNLVDESVYVGTWNAVSISYEGTEMTPDEVGLEFTLVINGDGTLAATTNGEDDGAGEWVETDDGISISDGTGAEMSGFLNGEQLVVDFGDGFIVTMEKE